MTVGERRSLGLRRLARSRALWRSLVVAVAVAPLVLHVWGAAALTTAVNVCPTVETAPVHSTGDAADDSAVWIHPTDSSLSTLIGTDKSTTGGLNIYDLSGRELYFKADGRLNNDDVRYNFPLGSGRVALVGATNRVARTLDFYKVNESDRTLTKVGSVPVSSAITTPRGFALYHSPVSGKYYAFVTDSGKTEQYELSGGSGQVTGTLVRKLATISNATEGLVADDELGRLYIAEEDIGGIWRFGAEPTDPTTGTRFVTTTENGGPIKQDVKGLTIYYASNGRGYLIAASQGASSFHIFNRGDNAYIGEFKIAACNGIDAVTGEDGIDVTNFNLGPLFPQGFFTSTDYLNDGANQNHKLVPWQSIANAFNPPLVIDASFDPRKIGAPSGPETTIDSGPSGSVSNTSASFSFSSSRAGSTFDCTLDAASFTGCTSPTSYNSLADGSHTFQVRATDTAGNADPTPATRTWTVDTTPPTVTTVSPADGAAGVPVGANVQATFSEAVDAATVTNSTFTLSRSGDTVPLPAVVTYDSSTKTATLDPSNNLATATSYTATVTVGVKDSAGNTMAMSRVWSFVTADTVSSGIKREAVTTIVNSTATNVIALPKPTGTAAGDVVVACLALNGGSVSSTGVPSGWSRIASVTATANPHVFGYYKVAGVFEPADYRWTLGSSVQNGAGIARYSGVDNTTPLDAPVTTAVGAAATSATVPGVTTTTVNAMLIGCMAINSSSTAVTIASPAGMTEAWDIGGKRHELADGIQSTVGASGPKTWMFSAGREWAGWLSALRRR